MSALRTVRAALAGVACVLVIACGAPDAEPAGGEANASPEPTTSVEFTPTASTEPGNSDGSYADGFVFTIQAAVDTTVRPEVIARSYDLLVVGRVVEELPAVWTTPDGRRPAVIGNNLPYPDAIVTPYVIELEVPDYLRPLTGPVIPLSKNGQAMRGVESNHIVAVVVGGTVGKDSFVNNTYSGLLTVGEQILVVLVTNPTAQRVPSDQLIQTTPRAPSDQLVPTTAGPGWWIISHFVLNTDGTAKIYDKTMSATQLVRSILDARPPELTNPTVP